MPSYLSPGVYVEEVPSAVQAIAGVGTSTAGFIGRVASNKITTPRVNPYHNPRLNEEGKSFLFNTVTVTLLDKDIPAAQALVGTTLDDNLSGDLPAGMLLATSADAAKVVTEVRKKPKEKQTVTIKNTGHLRPEFEIDSDNIGEPKLCTSFADFRKFFGDFSTDPSHHKLAHAVYGFFHNGGTRCYVAVMNADGQEDGVLEKFGAVDEIAIVAAPGLTAGNAGKTLRDKIVAHCKVATQDRMAIFDSPEEVVDANNDLDLTQLNPSIDKNVLPDNSDYAAFYFPWIQVFDPVTKILNADEPWNLKPDDPKTLGYAFVPPSGHMAGIYARVDTNRGVHKAPANEPVFGAVGLKYQISKAQQDGLNPQGVNCIRELNGAIRVWGARTIGGDANGEWRYINVRRTMLYLRESIDEGTQWAVFEPNDQNLWAKITRNITAFLTNVWRSGALFGSTAAEAFYVKCDAETNPPELRELGQVVTEIGVSIVRPAEFVIFRISQWQPQTAG